MERPSVLFRISSVIFRCQKYVKKGYMEMTKKTYLETLKSVLGHSVLHYPYYLTNCLSGISYFLDILPSVFD